jgi:tetratricopeptide (TPR) repeat protein
MRAWVSLTSAVLCWLLCAGVALAQRSDDDESELLLREARTAVAEKKYDLAARTLDRALAANPRRIDAYVLRAGVHSVKRQHAQAVALLQRAEVLAPDSLDVQGALGTQLILAGRAVEGAPILERVIARDPSRYQAHASLAGHYAQIGRHDKAIPAYRAYLETRPAALSREDNVHRAALGRSQLAFGDAVAARATFEAVSAADGKNLEAQFGRAWAVAAIDCREAIPMLEKLAALSEKYPELHLVRGQCARATGRTQRAIAFADQYLATKASGSGAAHALKGEAMADSGDLAGARREFEAALANDPKNLRLVIRQARVERLTGAPEAALKRLRATDAAEAASDFDFQLELAETQLALGDVKTARETVQPLVVTRPEHPGARLVLGGALIADGAWDGAIEHLEKGLALDPTSPRAKQLLSQALTASGARSLREQQPDAALATLGRAEELGGGGPALWKNLGIAYLIGEKPAQALPYFDRAAKGGRDAVALVLAARALGQLGRWDDARQRGEAALAISNGADVLLEVAANDLESGDAERAVARLDRGLAGAPAAQKGRITEAYRTAARAAASRAMAQGNYTTAVRHLERLLKAAPADDAAERIAVRCELALAATGAGDRDAAERALSAIEGKGVRCPFPPPADELAVPILSAIASGSGDATRAERALKRLGSLGRRGAGGATERLIADATRFVAIRAATDAYAKGRVDKARRFLDVARRQKGTANAPELTLDLAVLDLEAGRIDDAIRAFERVAGEVPEALIHLSIAYDKKGDRAASLEALERAERANVRFPPLKDWLAAKRRIYGGDK